MNLFLLSLLVLLLLFLLLLLTPFVIKICDSSVKLLQLLIQSYDWLFGLTGFKTLHVDVLLRRGCKLLFTTTC